MGDFSTRMRATADRLLTKYGQLVSFEKIVTDEYDVATGEVAEVSSTTYTAYGHPRAYTTDEIDGTLVQRNDLNLLVYIPTATPEIQDIATLDGIEHRVMNVTRTKAQGDVIVYSLQLRA